MPRQGQWQGPLLCLMFDLGARLLSLVHGALGGQQRAMAREALAEMRTIVAASHVDGGQLADLAEEWRLEAEPRCEPAGHALGWRCDAASANIVARADDMKGSARWQPRAARGAVSVLTVPLAASATELRPHAA